MYAQYDPAFDPDLHPELEYRPAPKPAPVKEVADPASVSYVRVQVEEEPQLVVTPAGFRYTADRFGYLEIKR